MEDLGVLAHAEVRLVEALGVLLHDDPIGGGQRRSPEGLGELGLHREEVEHREVVDDQHENWSLQEEVAVGRLVLDHLVHVEREHEVRRVPEEEKVSLCPC